MQITIKADLHVHTLASGHAYSTVDEVAQTASKKGLKLVAITNHGPAMPGASHRYYFGNMRIIPDKLYGVRLLSGVEANILNDGSLDLDDNMLERLDFVTAGIHRDAGYSNKTRKQHTQAIITAIKHPLVKMITHPANTAFAPNLEEIVRTAGEYNVILEANASSFYNFRIGKRGDYKMSTHMCKLAREYDVPISLNSDAHFHTEVGDITFLNEVIEKSGLEERNVINSSEKRILDFLKIK
ncbi:MAG: phosphatase [Halanaerobiales bacterium]